MWSTIATSLLCLTAAYAAPAKVSERDSLPTIAFPDATYRASGYNSIQDIYTFKNIRFAAPPTGDLRWAKPAAAPSNSALQDGSVGNRCPQAAINGLNVLGNNANALTAAVDQFITNKILAPIGESGGSEDCLFLDIYVPGSAIRGEVSNLPVVHWIYGGGYILGAKDQLQDFGLPFYDGSGLVSQSGNNLIFVGSNYRLGAFGFLAGKTMEQQGLPNAGLWDQRAAGQWIADNINLVGGDASDITVMGESAGAGSILHHLSAAGGTMAPWFKKAIMQSPAFQPMWDRQGSLESVFQQYLDLAGCSGKDLACLRAADSQTLIDANTKLNQDAVEGSFIVGPAADGSYVRQLAALEYASGNFAKVDSLLVSHTSSEATVFVDGNVSDDSKFVAFVDTLFPNYTLATGLNQIIENYYPNVSSPNSVFDNESDRVNALVRDSSFTCNARTILDAFSTAGVPAYAMQYSITPGWHATDLLPTFWSDGLGSSPLGLALEVAVPIFSSFANKYKSYLTSFVRAGDPNEYRDRSILSIPWTIEWPEVSNAGQTNTAQQFGNVLNAGDLGFSLINDDQDERDPCDFWKEVLAAATIQGGYSPPGAVVPSVYQADVSGASTHYAQ